MNGNDVAELTVTWSSPDGSRHSQPYPLVLPGVEHRQSGIQLTDTPVPTGSRPPGRVYVDFVKRTVAQAAAGAASAS